MALDLLAQESVQDTLDQIVAHAVTLVDGCEAAGIMVVSGQLVQTVAVTDLPDRWVHRPGPVGRQVGRH
ncbi:MAG: hypothetical protein QOC83_1407 [Pseudonocardiales bacterium]|jgi:hypothetical protein|nr:hypothetical protein [Pseudonocardiales bacterium]